MLSIGFLAETVALRYDEIFANKQIYFLLARVYMAGNTFTMNLFIFRRLMATSGCLLFLDSIYSFLTLYKESKILHAIVSRQNTYVEVLPSACPSVQNVLRYLTPQVFISLRRWALYFKWYDFISLIITKKVLRGSIVFVRKVF